MLQNRGVPLYASRAPSWLHWNRRTKALHPFLNKTRKGPVGHTSAYDEDKRITIEIGGLRRQTFESYKASRILSDDFV